MPIGVLIDVQYTQKTIFSFEKGLIGQNHSASGSHCPVKTFTPSKIYDLPLTPYCYWKTTTC